MDMTHQDSDYKSEDVGSGSRVEIKVCSPLEAVNKAAQADVEGDENRYQEKQCHPNPT